MARRHRKRTAQQAAILWACTLLGGAVAGWGVFLLAQIRVIRHLRDQVGGLGRVDRFFGKMTFLWRDPDEKLALALDEIPEAYLVHSETVAWWLLGLGLAGLALLVPGALRWRWR